MDAKPIPSLSSTSSAIQITHRVDRSLYTCLIQALTRPFRSRLGRPKKYFPPGSVELTPFKGLHTTCKVSKRKVCDVNVYDIRPNKTPLKDVKRRIYYYGGGGWQSPPSNQHWKLCAKMAQQLPGTIVSMVSYPLAPNSPASSAFPQLLTLYRTLMEEAEEAGERVILAGDSSGGNIVLCVALEALTEAALAAKAEVEAKRITHPVAIMAICPSTDLTRSNPDIQKLAKFDPILTPKFVNSTSKAWQGDWGATDRRLSPVNADISLLAKYHIHVHGITGGYDILSPDGIVFRDLLVKEGVAGRWLHWEKQMHCFPLAQPYGVREAKEAFAWLIDALKEE